MVANIIGTITNKAVLPKLNVSDHGLLIKKPIIVSVTTTDRYDLSVSYVGYETKFVPAVMVTAGKEVVLQIPLRQSIMEMGDCLLYTSEWYQAQVERG